MGDDQKIYSLMNDFVFKWIFGQEKHERNCICLLNALLVLEGENRIESLTFLNPFNYKEFADDKTSIIDTRVIDHKGELYNIEVQIVKEDAFVPRTVYYLAKLYAGQLRGGQPYNLLHKTTGLSILGFNLFKDSRQIHEAFEFRNIEGSLKLAGTMALHYLDMTRFDCCKPRELRSRFEKWLHIMKFGEAYGRMDAEIALELKHEEGLEMVISELKKINADAEKRQLMEAREKSEIVMSLRQGYAHKAGRELGREEGREEGLIAQRASICKILELRFQNLPDEILPSINRVKDFEVLKELLVQAAIADSVEAFFENIKAVTPLSDTSNS
ncbi:MAG: Rpn family recombination-promoting nuclease/putative transposase [Erysipelotrichia bacterium]|nr:Rpn family recombination-promoting nuclease/putative transposase [Erysipelotrichia bacterium]